jgi:hypothetical protein
MAVSPAQDAWQSLFQAYVEPVGHSLAPAALGAEPVPRAGFRFFRREDQDTALGLAREFDALARPALDTSDAERRSKRVSRAAAAARHARTSRRTRPCRGRPAARTPHRCRHRCTCAHLRHARPDSVRTRPSRRPVPA